MVVIVISGSAVLLGLNTNSLVYWSLRLGFWSRSLWSWSWSCLHHWTHSLYCTSIFLHQPRKSFHSLMLAPHQCIVILQINCQKVIEKHNHIHIKKF